MRVVAERQIGELGKLIAVSKMNAVQKSGRLRNAARAARLRLDEFLDG